MAVQRPGFKPNVKANMDSTKSDKIFVNVKEDTTVRFRFLPPGNKDGVLFTNSTNHFKLKSEEDRGMALACLNVHGEGDCYLCKLSKALKKLGKAEKKIGDAIRPSTRFNAQVLVAEKEGNKWVYRGPKILGLSPTTADSVNQILSNQEMVEDDFFTDPDKGQDILISRTGTGFNTKYKVDRTGRKMKLDDIFPEWSEKFITDLTDELNLTIVTVEEQKQAAMRTFGDEIPWEELGIEF